MRGGPTQCKHVFSDLTVCFRFLSDRPKSICSRSILFPGMFRLVYRGDKLLESRIRFWEVPDLVKPLFQRPEGLSRILGHFERLLANFTKLQNAEIEKLTFHGRIPPGCSRGNGSPL